MRRLTFIMLLCIAVLFTGCVKHHIRLQTDYLSRENLASFHVGTPDPLLYCPPLGQRLIMSWAVPYGWLREEDLKINLHMIFRNHTEECIQITLSRTHGLFTYCLVNEDYFEKGGILTYKAELIKGDLLLDEWVHQLWTDLIVIDPPQEEELCEEEEESEASLDISTTH